MLHSGQPTLTMSTSSAISPAHPSSAGGRLPSPRWLTTPKHAVPPGVGATPSLPAHSGSAGRLNFFRYAARSATTVVSAHASTIATILPAASDALGMLYALSYCVGPSPVGDPPPPPPPLALPLHTVMSTLASTPAPASGGAVKGTAKGPSLRASA